MNQVDEAITTTSAPVFSRIIGWKSAWISVRWRALLAWMILAGTSGLAIELGFKDWIEPVLRLVTRTLASYVGYSPKYHFMVMCHLLVLLNWFQPVALNLGLVRCLLWLGSSVMLGMGAMYMNSLAGQSHLLDLVLVGLLGGLPGLVVIGARTRPWMTFVGGAAAIGLLMATGWNSTDLGSGSLVYGMILANLPYAAVMLYGTEKR